MRDFKGNDPEFVAALLKHMDLAQHDGAAAVPGLNRNQLHKVRVSVPAPELQRRITGILRSLNDLIENNRRRVEVLEEMARAIYREWSVHFRFPGHEAATFVDSDLAPIPEGWSAPTLSELVSTQYGYTESASNDPIGPRYLRGMDINKTSYVDWFSIPYCPIDELSVDKFRVRVGDIFVILMADPGKVGMCEVDVDSVFASYLVRLRPLDERIIPYCNCSGLVARRVGIHHGARAVG